MKEAPINQIICGECSNIMKNWPDEFIDLTVTSPPYDDLRTYRGYLFDYKAVISELYRVTKPGGVVVWVMTDQTINGSETLSSFKHALFAKEIGFNLHDTMIWMKDSFSFPDNTRYCSCFEYMFVFSKGRPKCTNLISDRKNKWKGMQSLGTNRDVNGNLIKKTNRSPINEYGVRFNVWEIPSEKTNRTDHPAVFPERLAQDHIISWSTPDDIVLDPMCGSGTTCKMAVLNGRRYIGVDISEEYCEIARKKTKMAERFPRRLIP